MQSTQVVFSSFFILYAIVDIAISIVYQAFRVLGLSLDGLEKHVLFRHFNIIWCNLQKSL